MQIGPGMIQQVQGQVWLQVKNRRFTLIGKSWETHPYIFSKFRFFGVSAFNFRNHNFSVMSHDS